MNTAALQPPPVLVVDDEASIRLVLEHTVRRAGGHPVCAETKAAALELVTQQPWSCALVDKNLPDGSGVDVLRHLRAHRPQTPVIMLTGYANVDSAVEALRLGAFDYMTKPFDMEVLVHRIDQCLQRAKLQDENVRLTRTASGNEHLVSIGTMAAGIAHEVNNPLSYISNNLTYAREELAKLIEDANLPKDEREAVLKEVLQALGESAEGARRVQHIVRDLKGLSRSDATGVRRVETEHALDMALKLARAALPAHVKVEVSAAPAPIVRANELLLTQVVMNLLVNAGHAIPQGTEGRIQLSCGTDEDGWAFIQVQDNGTGIPDAHHDKVFEPFFTTKAPGIGTGLGLPLCRRTVEEVGGSLTFTTAAGQGTCFTVRLPPASSTSGVVPRA